MNAVEHFAGDVIPVLEHGLIFCPIPKAAGTSMRVAIGAAFGRPGETWKDTIKRLCRTPPETYKPADCYKVAITRNPWDRVASCYADKLLDAHTIRPTLAAMGCKLGMPFSDFVKRIVVTPDAELDKHLVPQHHKLFSERLGAPDVLCRFETIERDWESARHVIRTFWGAKLPPLKRQNVSRAPKPKFSDEDAALIAARYDIDIERLDYGSHYPK